MCEMLGYRTFRETVFTTPPPPYEYFQEDGKYCHKGWRLTIYGQGIREISDAIPIGYESKKIPENKVFATQIDTPFELKVLDGVFPMMEIYVEGGEFQLASNAVVRDSGGPRS